MDFQQWCDQDTCTKTKTSDPKTKTKKPNENHIIYMIGKWVLGIESDMVGLFHQSSKQEKKSKTDCL